MSQDHAASLRAGLTKALESKKYSDLTIICNGEVFPVHRVVVCQQCDFFYRLENFKEGEEAQVDLSADTPAAVRALIEYFYNGTYTTPADDENDMVFHIDVYAIACKYLVDGLQERAASRFAQLAENNWHTSTFVDAIRVAYGCTIYPSFTALQNSIVQIAHKNIAALNSRPEFRDVIAGCGAFANELVDMLTLKIVVDDEALIKYKCPQPSCSRVFSKDKGWPSPNQGLCPYCFYNPTQWHSCRMQQ